MSPASCRNALPLGHHSRILTRGVCAVRDGVESSAWAARQVDVAIRVLEEQRLRMGLAASLVDFESTTGTPPDAAATRSRGWWPPGPLAEVRRRLI